MEPSSADHAGSEFDCLAEVATELGLEHSAIPTVTRQLDRSVPGQTVSVVAWGAAPPELVFLHGGGQNARTWDLVALELGRSAVAIDLPGHGHSTWRDDHDYSPQANATAIAAVIRTQAVDAAAVVGMSLGGLTTLALAAKWPELVRRAVIVDVTPGSGQAAREMTRDQRGTTSLIDGPRTFASRDEMVALAVAASPRRPAAAVRRGVIHNTCQLPDGRWGWRYDRIQGKGLAGDGFSPLWADLASMTMPVMLVRGGDSSFVTDEDLARFGRQLPAARVEIVAGAGHSVQSDQPQALAGLISSFVFP
jgi:esterase